MRLRSPQIPRTRWLRRTARSLLSRRHRPRISGLEARLEGALPARERRPSRTSRHHRQALLSGYIESVLRKNFLLFCWKNIHEWQRLVPHFFFAFAGAIVTAWSGDSPTRTSLSGILRAFRQLPRAARRAGVRTVSLSWTTQKRSAARSRLTSTTGFRRSKPTRIGCGYSSCHPIRSVPRRMAAACSCITRCASCRAGAMCMPS